MWLLWTFFFFFAFQYKKNTQWKLITAICRIEVLFTYLVTQIESLSRGFQSMCVPTSSFETVMIINPIPNNKHKYVSEKAAFISVIITS